jgi:hypothetical protein
MGLAVGLLFAGCSEEIETPSGVSTLPPKPETPRGLTASIGAGEVGLTWTVSDEVAADRFVIYYSDSAATDMLVFDTTVNMGDTITGLTNGRTYYFRVATIDTSGIQGDQSTPVSATPGIFAIVIENGNDYTRNRSVTITLTAPGGVNLVQLSEDAAFVDAFWQSYSSSKNFELSNGDGQKTVYARFETDNGGITVGTVSDDIMLDRVAHIDALAITVSGTPLSGTTVYGPGEIMHFAVTTNEEGSEASVEIEGLTTVALNDHGSAGDVLPGDGIYEVDYVIPDETELTDAKLIAKFTDVAGNSAPELVSDDRLHVTSPPPAVDVWGYAASSYEAQIQWTSASISDFSAYRVFRSPALSPTDSLMLKRIQSQSETAYLDSDLLATTTYRYWVIVDDAHGNSTSSDVLSITTQANTAPDTLSIWGNFTGDSLTAKINWSQAAQAGDFEAYYIVRDISPLSDYSGSGQFPDSDKVIDIITSKATTSFTDKSIITADTYYYRVYVFDKQGQRTASNQATVAVPW